MRSDIHYLISKVEIVYRVSILFCLSLIAFTVGLGDNNPDRELRIELADQSIKEPISQDSLILDSLKNYRSNEIEISGSSDDAFGILSEVDGFGIYSGRKSEVIRPQSLNLNNATGNARQLYSKVAGLNIWENDPGGLQLGIGGRGLSPSRVSNFNTRQNGYDISADALGYPESYYTPTTQMLERIAIVRGAAALQYGTQFGGFVGFTTKKPPTDRVLEVESEQTLGSYGLYNSFLSIGGTSGKWNYIGMFQYKEGDGWRDNSRFHSRNFFISLGYDFDEDNSIKAEYTVLDYLAKQPGGLTDAQYYDNAQVSYRARNWFSVDWHVAALIGDFKLGDMTRLNTRNFLLVAKREALGYLGIIGRVEPDGPRDLLRGEFNNYGNETRLIHHYEIFDNLSTFLVGTRIYFGDTEQKQGAGADGIGANFNYLDESDPGDSDFVFPSSNFSVFAENVFRLGENLSLTPGFRLEYIDTQSDGYYYRREYNLPGDLIFEERREDSRNSERTFALFGLGASYMLADQIEAYGNISQNYRAINFNDLRVVNPNFRIDPELRDESGFSVDLGLRGRVDDYLRFDLNLFNINYNNKIGFDLRTDTLRLNLYTYRTNIADARTYGFESLTELDMMSYYDIEDISLPVFLNLSLIQSEYYSPENSSFDGNVLENAPQVIIRTGISFEWEEIAISLQYSYTGEQYTDATNADFSPYAVAGLVPSYEVVDLSVKYTIDDIGISAGATNLLDRTYFTRRAAGYPGPGIIPAEPRNFYVSVSFVY